MTLPGGNQPNAPGPGAPTAEGITQTPVVDSATGVGNAHGLGTLSHETMIRQDPAHDKWTSMNQSMEVGVTAARVAARAVAESGRVMIQAQPLIAHFKSGLPFSLSV
jgi:hypothetical protein